MKYLKHLTIVLSLATLASCNLEVPNEEPNVIDYNNIMIYSDLSSRMNNNPNDTSIINQIVDFFVTDCVKPGIKVNDRSSISFSRANHQRSNCSTAKIDIGHFKNLEEKQKFVNNKSTNGSLNSAIMEFKNSVRCNYLERDKGGLDLLSLIYQEVNSGNHIKKPDFILNERDTTTLYYHNHLFIFTDGYLEYAAASSSKDFYYGAPQIEALRKFCKTNKVDPEKAIRDNPQFKIRPLISENNKYVNLYIMETDERGFDIVRGTLKNTGDLSDNNILKLVWKVWAEESEFKSFEWKQMTTAGNLSPDFLRQIIKKS